MNKLILILILPFLSFSQEWIDTFGEDYYGSCIGLSGPELKQELHDIIKSHTPYSYSQVKDILRESDEDPNNDSNVILVYTGNSIDKLDFASLSQQDFWNREHVWPKSHGGFGPGDDFQTPAYTDVHNLKPCDTSMNSYRNDKDFESGGDTVFNGDVATQCFGTNATFEPRDEVKGDIARIIFYMDIRYEGGDNEPNLYPVNNLTTYPYPEIGTLSTLLEWHLMDPPDEFEKNRNNVIYQYQGNRNPLIDYPELVSLLYNNLSDEFTLSQDIQQIDFTSGWGMWSTYISPENSDIASVFSDLVGDVEIVKDQDGNVYWPEYNLNSIGSLIPGQGYLIKMSNNNTLVLEGDLIQTDLEISLNSGWSIIGYLLPDYYNIVTLMNPILDEVIIVKDQDGNVYWPEYNLNSIGNMEPGKGYQIKIDDDVMFNYPNIQ
tara:strand:+ start:29 stop:1327 length:1299 start_codon:yes stop_codon:yes gene_type:complete